MDLTLKSELVEFIQQEILNRSPDVAWTKFNELDDLTPSEYNHYEDWREI